MIELIIGAMWQSFVGKIVIIAYRVNQNKWNIFSRSYEITYVWGRFKNKSNKEVNRYQQRITILNLRRLLQSPHFDCLSHPIANHQKLEFVKRIFSYFWGPQKSLPQLIRKVRALKFLLHHWWPLYTKNCKKSKYIPPILNHPAYHTQKCKSQTHCTHSRLHVQSPSDVRNFSRLLHMFTLYARFYKHFAFHRTK